MLNLIDREYTVVQDDTGSVYRHYVCIYLVGLGETSRQLVNAPAAAVRPFPAWRPSSVLPHA